MAEPRAAYGGVGWSPGSHHDYDREYCVDLAQLAPSCATPSRRPPRLWRWMRTGRRGASSWRGCRARSRSGAPSRCCATASGTARTTSTSSMARPRPATSRPKARFEQNRFTVTRQLRYSRDESQRALDIGLFINGLPVFTFELKNTLTKQTVEDAVWQYKKDRNPREKLFELGRCVAHFAVGRERGALLHPPQGQGVVVPALQPRLERRRRQSAQPERDQDRLSVARGAHPREPDPHPRELRPAGGVTGREDGQEEADANLAALPSA